MNDGMQLWRHVCRVSGDTLFHQTIPNTTIIYSPLYAMLSEVIGEEQAESANGTQT